MNILAFDSSTTSCSAAVWRDGTILGERFLFMERGQSEALIPMIRTVLAVSDIKFVDLHLVATTLGPGAFVGLRICLSTARALSLAARLPIVGVTTFEAIASAQGEVNLPLLVAIDSKRADCYVQLYNTDRIPIGPPSAVLPSSIEAMLPDGQIAIAGTGGDVVKEALDCAGRDTIRLQGNDYPKAVQVAILAAQYAKLKKPGYGETPPEPIYLRAPDATPASSKLRSKSK